MLGERDDVSCGAHPAERIWTIPNAITLARLACIPVFVWLLFGLQDRIAAAGLVAGLGASDWLDGWLARRLGHVSTVGQVLDPVADRVLIATTVVATMVDGSVPAWLGVAVVCREALVSIAVVVLAALGAERIDVVWVGKAGTLGLMFALPLFLAGHANISSHQVAEIAAWCFAIPGLALSWYAAARYVPRARNALRRGRIGSRP